MIEHSVNVIWNKVKYVILDEKKWSEITETSVSTKITKTTMEIKINEKKTKY